jgi:hypothetical protein
MMRKKTNKIKVSKTKALGPKQKVIDLLKERLRQKFREEIKIDKDRKEENSFIFRHNGQRIAEVSIKGNKMKLKVLVFDVNLRGLQLGNIVLEEIEKLARKNNLSEIYLDAKALKKISEPERTIEEHKKVIQFYSKNGFLMDTRNVNMRLIRNSYEESTHLKVAAMPMVKYLR